MKKNNTNSEEIDEKRYRNFMFILYEDTDSYNFKDILFDLKGSFKNYAYIKHKPEDNEKKEHYHFILSLDNTRTIQSIANRVGIPLNHIQPVRSLRASCRYLPHQDNDDKIKYELTDVVVSKSFSRKFFGSFDDLKTEQDIIDDIYNYIDCLPVVNFHTGIRKLIMFVNNQCYDTIYKRYRLEFQDYFKSRL